MGMEFSGARILCVGDIMLDRFCYCAIERISPEAPVPVLHVQSRRSVLGGVGNVARNIASLGGEAVLIGLVGQDAAADELSDLIGEAPAIVAGHARSAGRPTICKTRFVAGHQQVMRVDEESTHPLDENEYRGVLRSIDEFIDGVSAVILSDYGKGVLDRKLVRATISRARARQIPVFVDPKTDDFRHYRGATCVTPNLAELARAARMPVRTEAEILGAATRVMRDAQSEAILCTRSEKGMMLVEASGAVHVEPARAREVFDVTGAGDTVIAVLALAVAAGHALPDAMRLANTAAGIAVSKLGTATVELDELMFELSREARERNSAPAKYYSVAEVETLVRHWKSRGLSVGFTNGCFDIVHPGHVGMLAAARAECDRLVVALNNDNSVRRLKGASRPINTLADRCAVMSGLESVDAVISFADDTPLDLIRRLKPDVLMKGADYTVETVVGAEDVIASGGRVALIDLVEGHSTTKVIGRMQAPAKVD
jgi:D-beta-D-heptose 7-phosphate kinase / D-beta-D-heptose 1-phosphate adenosyltransferase